MWELFQNPAVVGGMDVGVAGPGLAMGLSWVWWWVPGSSGYQPVYFYVDLEYSIIKSLKHDITTFHTHT